MAPLILDGTALSRKHRNYNTIVNEFIENKQKYESKTVEEDSDIENLMRIDVECKNKNVDYILTVLKSDDMLYVSRAIRKSTWLITEDQHAHIINAKYLHTHLFPYMTTKAIVNFTKSIRQNLKDEVRCQEFYDYEGDIKDAIKWLPNCSLPFTEDKMRQYCKESTPNIKTVLLKRLCQKSISIPQILIKENKNGSHFVKRMKFLLFTNTDAYLDIVEKANYYEQPKFGNRATGFIMKKCPDRIINNFKLYAHNIHIPTFAKHLKKEDIKDFVLNLTKEDKSIPFHIEYTLFQFKKIKFFIDLIPSKERFEFVKKVFIDKIHDSDKNTIESSDNIKYRELCTAVSTKLYDWYIFAPFEIAFFDLKELIKTEQATKEKYNILDVLINCTRRNIQHIHALLKYYSDQHMNDEVKYKRQFINKLLSELDINKCTDDIWFILNNVFKSMNVYVENENIKEKWVEFILLYLILQNDQIPNVIENKFQFNTLKPYQRKMNSEEKSKTFGYLFNFILTKLNKINIFIEKDFKEAVGLMEKVLVLLKDWNKELQEYPVLLEKIRNLIKIKKENSWSYSLASIYNVKKSWRRDMFEESLDLNPSQDSCINALKHDSTLLLRHQSEVDSLCTNDKVSLKRFLNKLRIYWPQTLANDWKNTYLARLESRDQPKNQIALIRGLCIIQSQKDVTDMITKYTPKEAKIDWNEADNSLLSLRRELAKNMHLSRPQPSPELLLPYCKGDYLQYALPSLIATFYNLNTATSRQFIPKLLNAPVSLQKHGIRFAFSKLNPDEIKVILSDLWKNTKNSTIRAVVFKHTYDLLCKPKEKAKIIEVWNLLSIFIDNLSFEEDKKIYELLSAIDKVPLYVRADYLMKSLKFFKTMLLARKSERQKYEWVVNTLMTSCRNLMEYLDTEFVIEMLLEYIDTNIFTFEKKSECPIERPPYYIDAVPILSAFILCAKNKEEQMVKYERVLAPLLKRSLANWDHFSNNKFIVRRHMQQILTRLTYDLENYVIEKNMVMPTEVYKNIQTLLETLPVSENYIMLTKWKLTVAFVNLLDNKDKADWNALCEIAVPEYGKICLQYLKKDINAYFPRIYVLFSKALKDMFEILPVNMRWKILKCMLIDKQCIEAYLCTLKLLVTDYTGDSTIKNQIKELHETIHMHTSVEVKIHYYNKYKPIDYDANLTFV